jgi:hypothetical protein
VAIQVGLHYRVGRYVAVRSATVLGDVGLAEIAAHALGKDACHHIGRAARREATTSRTGRAGKFPWACAGCERRGTNRQ